MATKPMPAVTTAADTTAAVEARSLFRSFGSVRALDNFEVVLGYGQVVALVGPNGAGKTTLLLVLAGLLAADRGTVRVAGNDPVSRPFEVHRAVGWMPDFFGVYDDLSPREYLELFGAAYRLPPTEAAARAVELLATVRLQHQADVPVHTLSRGQKQKLGLARALVHRPRILLLDEPAGGLDPRARMELRDLVRQQAAEGACVVISSHVLAELEEMADTVVLMSKGRCAGVHSLKDLPRPRGAREWRVRVLNPDVLHEVLRTERLVPNTVRDGEATLMVDGEDDAAELCRRLIVAGARVVEFAPASGGLEGAFMALGDSGT